MARRKSKPERFEWIPTSQRAWRSSDGQWTVTYCGGYRLKRAGRLVAAFPTFTDAHKRCEEMRTS